MEPSLKGRSAQTVQTGIELIGSSSKMADLEVIATANTDALTFCCKPFGTAMNISDRYSRTLDERIYTGHEMFSYCQLHGEFYPTVWLYFLSLIHI